MKRVWIMMLCIGLVLSLTACGGGTEATPTTVHAEQPQETLTEPAETVEQTEAPTDPPETEPAFDAGWAGAEYEMPVPEPPFAYKVEVEGGASGLSVTVKATNGGMEGDVTHEMILDYCEAFKQAGFTLELYEKELGERSGRVCYEFSAVHESGAAVYLIDDGGGVVMIVSVPDQKPAEDEPEGNMISTDDSIPEFPDMTWEAKEEDGYTLYKAKEADQSVMEDYVQTLRDAGWFLLAHQEDGKWIFWTVQNELTGQIIELSFNTKTETAQIIVNH